MKTYKVINGVSYDANTSESVIAALELAREKGYRIILDYGDTTTGESWGETYDISGYIGRSMGTIKIPILLYNSRSIGGCGILDHRIIKIRVPSINRVLYQHPTYKPCLIDRKKLLR